ncbi:MAG: class I SAM-dependent methyltransferase [Saprospiraceae bacterium]|nr:class I SAM-dependent methyltransferase [Saprospiraceae bacterium]
MDLHSLLGSTDIYLIDQILKGLYRNSDIVLDAGCGSGRNLPWFISQKIEVYGIDQNLDSIQELMKAFEIKESSFKVAELSQIPFPDKFFDHVISSAVLHFARSESHFFTLMEEHLRVLRVGGSFFVRMASNIGLEKQVQSLENGRYLIPDGSVRFLLKHEIIETLQHEFNLKLIEPVKTTNVGNMRCMTTLVLRN